MRVKALGKCHKDCPFCAREFWKWFKARMHQMDRPRRGEKESFNDAAINSRTRFKNGV